MTCPSDDGRLIVREWPISEWLPDGQTVELRWGPGTYIVDWYGTTERGARNGMGKSRQFEIRPPVDNSPRPVETAHKPEIPGFAAVSEILKFTDDRTAAQLSAITQVASVLAAGGARGTDQTASMMQLILDKQATQFAMLQQQAATEAKAREEALMTQLRALQQKIEEREAEEEDDEDGAGEMMSEGVRAALPAYKRGQSWGDVLKQGFFAAVMADPGKALETASTVLEFGKKAVEAFGEAQKQKTPPPAPAAPRELAPPVRVRPRPPEPSPPIESGINAAMRQSTPPPPPPPPVAVAVSPNGAKA